MSDLISRQQAIDAMCLACGHDCDKSKFVYNAPQDEQVIMCPEHYALSTMPPAQPEQLSTNLAEVGTDCISRQAAMKLLRDDWQASESRGDAERAEIAKFHFIEISNLPAAQSEPCEDAVNRETLLKFFDGWMSALDENCHNQSVSDLKIIKRDFANLPPVTPKQRTGKWIPQDHNKRVGNISTCVYYYPICSKCGKVGIETYKYCPHCGADMREETT